MSKVYKLPNITINDLIKILSDLPDEAKEMKVDHICGCRDCETSGFQFTLLDENNENHNKYVLVPRYTDEVMYDSFGKRSLKNKNINVEVVDSTFRKAAEKEMKTFNQQGYELLEEYRTSLLEYWKDGHGEFLILVSELQGFLDCLTKQELIKEENYMYIIECFKEDLKTIRKINER